LLENGAPVDGLPSSGESPLHGAVSLGESQVAEVLIKFGANLEKIARYPGIPNGTPLDFAVHFGMVDVVDILVTNGAQILSARMAAGAGLLETLKEKLLPEQLSDPFRCACVCDRVRIVEYLLGEGLDVNADIEGASGLHWAAWEAKPSMVRYLVDNGADTNLRDQKHKMTPAEWAKHRSSELGPRWGHNEVLDVLEKA
jgi:ankyrin repeat protein